MAALYELTAKLANFELEIDEETGEILNEDALTALTMERDEKIENIGLWIKNLKAEAEAVKAEADKLMKRSKAAKNKAERLTAYLTEQLAGEKFKTCRLSISYRGSKAVEIVDFYELPGEYKRMEITADKASLKKALQEGQEIPGARLEERTSTIVK